MHSDALKAQVHFQAPMIFDSHVWEFASQAFFQYIQISYEDFTEQKHHFSTWDLISVPPVLRRFYATGNSTGIGALLSVQSAIAIHLW